MTVAGRPTSGDAPFDEVRLRLRDVRYGISIFAAKPCIAFVPVVDECHGNAKLAGTHPDVWNAIWRRTEVGMSAACASDEIDVGIRLRIDRG